MPPFLGRDLLSIYLNDHLAGATAGLDLARRARGANEGTPLGGFLAELEREIEEDRDELQRIMERVDAGRDHLKVTAGWAAEKAGRLKLNGRITGYSPLSRLLELEGLLIGVQGKRAGWEALLELAPAEPRVDAEALRRLIERADRQIEGLAGHRRRAAAEALAER